MASHRATLSGSTRVIIPWQKRPLKAIKRGEPVADIYGEHPGFRSRHNHYLALPVLFLMLGNHAPVNFESPFNWLVVALLVLSMGLLKHFHTLIQRSQPSVSTLAIGLVVFGAAVLLDATQPARGGNCTKVVMTERVTQIVSKHCDSCHMAGQAPALGSPDQWLEQRGRIRERVLRTRTMPPMNVSSMSEAERTALGCWLAHHDER